VGNHEGLPNATKAHLLLPSLVHEEQGPFLMASFSSTPEMASSTTTSQASRRRKPGPLHNLPRRGHRSTTAKPTRRSPSKSNKLTVSHSNKSWWRAQHYARMQSKNTKGAQILHPQIPPKQQVLGRN